MRDAKAPLLLLLSTGLLGTWIYHLYDKSRYASAKPVEVLVKDSSTIESRIRDSLHALFTDAMDEMKMRQTSGDSLRGELESRVSEIYRLRNDISSILKNRNITQSDLQMAKSKIGELQQKIDEIRSQNSELEEERMQLNTTLDQLSNEMKELQESVVRLGQENSKLTATINEASTFVASEMSLKAIRIRKGEREQETDISSRTDKFVISFYVQNNITSEGDPELVMVLSDPLGNVMQNPAWASANFQTRTEGKKPYTIKFLIDYQRGENKQIQFSLNPDKFMNGTYKLQVYHNGALIGTTTRFLQ